LGCHDRHQRTPTSAPLNAYTCTDIDDGYSTTVRAESAAKAAQAYVDGGGWHVDDRTIWIRVQVDGHGVHRIAIEPEAPTCANNSDGHDWRDLYTTGSGGGVLITERRGHSARSRASRAYTRCATIRTIPITSPTATTTNRGHGSPSLIMGAGFLRVARTERTNIRDIFANTLTTRRPACIVL